jgi:FMN phosphatase YigB (HAD superfamily)
MTNEHASGGVRMSDALGRTIVRVVLFDAHGVMFSPKDGSHIDLQKRMLEEALGRKVDIDAYELAIRGRLARLEAVKRFPLNQLGSREVWGWSNARAFADLGMTEELGSEMSRLISLPEHYHTPESVAKELRWLLEEKFPFKGEAGFFIATASNSEAHIVEALLDKSGIREHFRHIFTADNLDGIYKPSEEYFRALIAKANEAQAIISPDILPIRVGEILFIGNSVLNDAPAAAMGINTLIINDQSDTLTSEQIDDYLGETKDRVIWADDWPHAHKLIDEMFGCELLAA